MALGNFGEARAAWTLNGQLNDQATLQITLDDRQIQARLSTAAEDRALLLDLSEDLSQQLQPDGSGGLLVAMHLWRRLLTLGPAQFGEVYYVGTAPWPNYPQLTDVLVGVHDVVESRFYFDTHSGQLIGMEMFPDSESDPCEIAFRDYRTVDGGQVPFEFEVRHGDVVYGVLKLQEFATRPTPVEGT